MPRPARAILIPRYRFAGNKDLAITHSGIAQSFLNHSNRIFGGNKSFSTFLELPDGTKIFATKTVRQYMVRIVAPFFGEAEVPGDQWRILYTPRYVNRLSIQGTFTADVIGEFGYQPVYLTGPSSPGSPNLGEVIPKPTNPAFSPGTTGWLDEGNGYNPTSLVEDDTHILLTRGSGWSTTSSTTEESHKILRRIAPNRFGNEYIPNEPDVPVGGVGQIDWRSDSGDIYTIKGPAGRGIPTSISGVDFSSSSTSESENNHQIDQGTVSGQTYSNRFKSSAFQDGIRVFTKSGALVGFCVKNVTNPSTLETKSYYIAAMLPNNRDIKQNLDLYSQQTGLDELGEPFPINLMTKSGTGDLLYSPICPIFFSSSANKGISTYPDYRETLNVTNTPGTELINIHSYSTLRLDIIDDTSYSYTITEEGPAEFDTSVREFVRPEFRTLFDNGSEIYNTVTSFTLFNIGGVYIEGGTPTTIYKTRISSDFKYKTEEEVFLSKEVSLETASTGEVTTTFRTDLNNIQEGFNDATEATSSSHTLITKYYISRLNEGTSLDAYTPINEPDFGIDIPTLVSTGNNTEHLLLEITNSFVFSETGFSKDARFELDTSVFLANQDSSSTDIETVANMVCCDLRFSLCCFLVKSRRHEIATSREGFGGGLVNILSSTSVVTNKGYMCVPMLYLREIEDLDDITNNNNYRTSAPPILDSQYNGQQGFTPILPSTLPLTPSVPNGPIDSVPFVLPYDKYQNLSLNNMPLDQGTLFGQFDLYEYTLVGLDADPGNYIFLTPWVDHLLDFDFDESNDLLPEGLPTNVSDHAFVFETEELMADRDNYKDMTIFRGIVNGKEPEDSVGYPA